MESSGARIDLVLRATPRKGSEVNQARYDRACQRALAAMAEAFESEGLPLAKIDGAGEVVYRATNQRGGPVSWP